MGNFRNSNAIFTLFPGAAIEAFRIVCRSWERDVYVRTNNDDTGSQHNLDNNSFPTLVQERHKSSSEKKQEFKEAYIMINILPNPTVSNTLNNSWTQLNSFIQWILLCQKNAASGPVGPP